MIEVINVKILHLVVKKKWYEMQESGEKTEEYRELSPYWRKRLIDQETLRLKPYTHVCFHCGYTQRCFINRIDSITIGRGNPEWGAPTDRDVFIIKHHREKRLDIDAQQKATRAFEAFVDTINHFNKTGELIIYERKPNN